MSHPEDRTASPYGEAAPRNGHAVAGLVLGIVALATCWIPLAYLVVAAPCGIVGIVQGVTGRRLAADGLATNPGVARAAVICSVTGVALCVLNLAFGAILASSYTG